MQKQIYLLDRIPSISKGMRYGVKKLRNLKIKEAFAHEIAKKRF